MNGHKKLRIGCLFFSLLVVILPAFLLWREWRQEGLSAQLLTTLKNVQSISEMEFDNEDDKDGRQQESLKRQIIQEEAKVVRLLQAGADPNVRDFPTVKRTFWEKVKFVLKRMLRPPPASAALPRSALAIAVQADDAVIVQALLKAGANDVNAEIDTNDRDGRHPLVNYAAYVGNLEIVQALCAHGADIRKPSHRMYPEGIPILQSALAGINQYGSYVHRVMDVSGDLDRKRRTEIFHLLLAQGAKYEPNSEEGYGLLSAATDSDLLQVTSELLAAGVPIHANPKWSGDFPGDSPLNNAVGNDDLALVKLLLKYGASTHDTHSESPVLYAHSPEVAGLLLEHGADLHAEQERGKRSGENALNFACIEGNTKMVSFWIGRGLKVNSGGEYSSPIDEAAEYGGLETVRLLLKQGAKVGPNSPGADALWLAIAEQHFDSAKLILQYGAAVNPKPTSPASDTEYPLVEAVRQDNAAMALELLKHGADVNAGKGAALIEACGSCDEDLVELLLEHGTDPNARAFDGTTAIQWAKENADPRSDADGIIAMLKDYGAKQ